MDEKGGCTRGSENRAAEGPVKLEFLLDGEAITITSDPLTAASELLKTLRAPGTAAGVVRNSCKKGLCGLCTLIFNGQPALACLIPAYRLHQAELLTAASFAAFSASFRRGAEFAGAHFCGYCDQARTIAAWYAIAPGHPLDTTRLREIACSIRCPCVPVERFERAIGYAADIEHNRIEHNRIGAADTG